MSERVEREAMSGEELARIARALSDPLRLRILELVAGGREGLCCPPPLEDSPEGLCVCHLQDALGMAQSKISYHMGELRQAGLVRERKRSRWTFYSVNEDRLRAFAGEVGARLARAPALMR